MRNNTKKQEKWALRCPVERLAVVVESFRVVDDPLSLLSARFATSAMFGQWGYNLYFQFHALADCFGFVLRTMRHSPERLHHCSCDIDAGFPIAL
jgi:hypothetical protein